MRQIQLKHILLQPALILALGSALPGAAAAQNYCTPTVGTPNTTVVSYGLGIGVLQFGNISDGTNNITDYAGAYVDKTNISDTISAGQIRSVSVTSGATNTNGLGIWIDLNNDGVFASNELLYSATYLGTTTGDITIPLATAPGPKRMRLGVEFGGTPNPCGPNAYGQFKDFEIVVLNSQTTGVDIGTFRFVAPVVFGSGNNDLTVDIYNVGKDSIGSTDVGYLLSGSSAVTTSLSGTSFNGGVYLQPGQRIRYTFTTPVSLTSGLYTIKAWARNPNSTYPDLITDNDTTQRSLCVGMRGTYTIGATGNYASFNAAVSALAGCGVAGPVIFNVEPGTYNEQVVIGTITGAFGANTVTFQGTDTASVKLVFAATTAGNSHTLRLTNTKRIIFRDIQIQTLGGTQGYAVNLTSGADSNEFHNCRMYAPTLASGQTGVLPVTISGTASYATQIIASQNLFNSCSMSGGYSGISAYLTGSNGNVVNACRITDAYYAGIFLSGNTFGFITGNTVLTRTTMTYGIFNNTSNVTALDNRVGLNGSYASIGIQLSGHRFGRAERNIGYGTNTGIVVNDGTQAVSGTNQLFINNIGYGASASSQGINYTGTNGTVVHNTALGGSYGMSVNGVNATGNLFVNNICATRSTTAGALFVTVSTNLSRMDNNIYYATSATELVNMGGAYPKLADLQSAFPTWNQNSKMMTPGFESTTDLHLAATTIPEYGEVVPGVTLDVDGQSRCAVAPSIGADENGYFIPNPALSMLAPDTIWLNSTVRLYVGVPRGGPVAYEWDFGNDGVVDDVNYSVDWTFTNYGLDSIKLRLIGCGGTDSVVKYVWVDTPPVAPVPNFIASKTVLTPGEDAELIDLSKFGPETYKWTANPSTGVTFLPTDDSPFPIVSFAAPGEYEICLEATNVRGTASICKSEYIYVAPEFAICTDKIGATKFGYLRDNGGSANYTKNSSGNITRCGFQIDPCATEVAFKFNTFALNATSTLLGADSVILRDGVGAGAPVIAAFTSNNAPVIGLEYMANSGKMYVEFVVVDNQLGGSNPGFEGVWSSTPDLSVAPPSITMDAFDTAYVGVDYIVRVRTPNNGLLYNVEMDGDPSALEYVGEFQKTFTYNYGLPGTYEIKVTANGCSGTDSVSKTIEVLNNPIAAPDIDFTADKQTINLGDTVQLEELVRNGPAFFEWEFFPNSVVYLNGTNSTSRDPMVSFQQTGYYSVKLFARNFNTPPDDTAALWKMAYIHVIQYCEPSVAQLNSDIGISRVTFGTMDNSSAQAQSFYTDYSGLGMTTLNRGTNYTITVERNTTLNKMNRKVWIDYNRDGIFDPVTELVASESPAQTASYTATFRVPKRIKEGPSRLRVGVSYDADANGSCGINPYGEFEDYAVYLLHAPDTEKPLITRIGNDTTIEVGSAYNDLGATAFDVFDQNLTANITVSSNVDPNVLGTYQVVYNVADSSGNMADSVVRIVNVIDTQAPVMTLLGNDPDSVKVFSNWNDPGVSIIDNYYTGLTANAGTVNTSRVGTYVVNYTVSDGSGNAAAPLSRTVVVYDDEAPLVQLLGADTVVIDVFSSFTDPGISAIDNYYNNVELVKTGSVNTNKLGEYILSYYAEDSSGNVSATLTRTVKVIDRVAPVILLNGAPIMYHQLAAPFTDPGVIVTDNYNNGLVPDVVSDLDVHTEGGPYFITYNAVDSSGNKAATVVRTIYVKAFASVVENTLEDTRLYPNPSNGIVHIELGNDAPVAISVVNSLGQTVQAVATQTGEGKYVLNLDGLSAGTYLIRLKTADATWVKPVNLVK